ncbi:DUF2971 domain-containing protein [Mesorhizobium muleiense]|uniref:DUF2971 domain-containing protein n=1 Tax=Mesorhizobium muleiense TaxID=1004279 RepID=UPI003AFA9C4D
MRLYYFTSDKYGLSALEKRRLKIARLNELNDPFEFLGWNIKDRSVRAKLKAWKNERNEELGILCFSRTWSNPLLWGHYAEKHKGVAIGFDVPARNTFKVGYRDTRLAAPSGRDLTELDVEALLLTKFRAWSYETEQRCFCRLKHSIQENGLYFEPLSKIGTLAEVIVGDRSTISRDDLAQVLGNEFSKVKTFKARPAFGTFTVVRNRDSRLWV